MEGRARLIENHLAAPFWISETFPGPRHIGLFDPIRAIAHTVSQMPVIEDLAAKFRDYSVHSSFNRRKVMTESPNPVKILQGIFLIQYQDSVRRALPHVDLDPSRLHPRKHARGKIPRSHRHLAYGNVEAKSLVESRYNLGHHVFFRSSAPQDQLPFFFRALQNLLKLGCLRLE